MMERLKEDTLHRRRSCTPRRRTRPSRRAASGTPPRSPGGCTARPARSPSPSSPPPAQPRRRRHHLLLPLTPWLPRLQHGRNDQHKNLQAAWCMHKSRGIIYVPDDNTTMRARANKSHAWRVLISDPKVLCWWKLIFDVVKDENHSRTFIVDTITNAHCFNSRVAYTRWRDKIAPN